MAAIHPEVIQYEIISGGYTFKCTAYIKPSSLTPYYQREIVKRLGDRIVKGKICLGTTKEIVQNGLEGHIYDAVIFVKNSSLPDGQQDIATGCLQYQDYCKKGHSQLWITDVCRQMDAHLKPTISPTKILMSLYEDLAKSAHIPELYLMVDKEDPVGHHTLTTKIYPGYGFTIDPTCDFEDHTIMKKRVTDATVATVATVAHSRSKTFKRRKNGSRSLKSKLKSRSKTRKLSKH